MFKVTDRTVRRWLAIYRKNPDIVALLPKPKGHRVGTRRLRPDTERLLNDVIGVWAAKAEHLGPNRTNYADSLRDTLRYCRSSARLPQSTSGSWNTYSNSPKA